MINKPRMLLLIFATKLALGSEVDLCSTDKVDYTRYITKDIIDCNCNSSSCIRKCCRHGFEYFPRDVCMAWNSSVFKPFDYSTWDKKLPDLESGDGFRIGMLKCHPVIALNEEVVNYLHDGSVYLTPGIFSPTEYCIDRTANSVIYYYYCPETMKSKNDEMKQGLTCVGGLISTSFLLATFLVYVLLPERGIHKNALVFHSFSLTSHNVLIALDQYYTLSNVKEHYTLCIISGYFKLYLKSAAYFWVNVMFLDIWLALRGLREVQKQSDKKKIHFIIFSIYAWGVPGLFLLMSLLGEGIDVNNCYLKASEYRMLDFLPEVVLYLINVALFVLITRNMQRIKHEIARVESSNSRSNSKSDDQFTFYWNLFFIVGYLTFINLFNSIELLTWNSSKIYAKSLDYSRAIVGITYGIGIFTLYVCKKEIRKAIKGRYHQITRKPKENEVGAVS